MKLKRFTAWFVMLALAVVFVVGDVPTVKAEETGSIKVTVIDGDKDIAVSGVVIQVYSSDGGTYTATTNENGIAEFTDLPITATSEDEDVGVEPEEELDNTITYGVYYTSVPTGYIFDENSGQSVTLISGETSSVELKIYPGYQFVLFNAVAYTLSSYEDGEFQYYNYSNAVGYSYITGVVCNIIASSDVYDVYGDLVYSEGTIVHENLTTGDKLVGENKTGTTYITSYGFTVADLLVGSSGSYVLEVIDVPDGYYLYSSTGYHEGWSGQTYTLNNGTVDLGETSLLYLARQTATVTVNAVEEGTTTAVSGGSYTLCAGEDICNSAGTVIVEKDTAIETVTATNGTATFSADIPYGYSYYVMETTTPSGYESQAADVFSFTFANVSTTQNGETYAHTFEYEEVVTTTEATTEDVTTEATTEATTVEATTTETTTTEDATTEEASDDTTEATTTEEASDDTTETATTEVETTEADETDSTGIAGIVTGDGPVTFAFIVMLLAMAGAGMVAYKKRK